MPDTNTLREFQCGRKKLYPDKRTAKEAALRMEKKTHKGQKFAPIECRWCTGWHIGRNRTAYGAEKHRANVYGTIQGVTP